MASTSGATVEKRERHQPVEHEPLRHGPYYRPLVDILETAEELRVLADMPGLEPENIEVNFENGVLTLHGRVEPRQPADTTYLLREYGVGDFYRVFELSETIDSGKISAEYEDGVLVLHLPKAEAAKARKIEVRGS